MASPTSPLSMLSDMSASVESTDRSQASPLMTPPAFLLCKRLSAGARLPTRGSAEAAGYDLHAAEDAVVGAGSRGLVGTGLAITAPAGTYARVAPRSGLAVKHGIGVGAGVVDADYRGEVRVLLLNHGVTDLHVRAGDRIAQLILEKIQTATVREVSELDTSDRGAGGFGSTGV